MVKKIPSSWLPITPLGEPVEGTRFICFKTPLSEDRFTGSGIDADNVFTVSELVKRVNEKGKRLGMVVSCCSRLLYDPDELEKNGVEYHLQVPHVLREADKAIHNIKKYLKKQKDENVLVGVHCLHGINRTGYLMCTYMIRELGFEPDEAIRRFELARGHEIETTKSDIRRHR